MRVTVRDPSRKVQVVSIGSYKFASHRARISGELDPRKDSYSTKL